MSSCSAAVVEYLGGVDNLAHYGRSLGLIEGLLKVRVADTPIGAPMNSTPRMRWVSPAEELPGAGRPPILIPKLDTARSLCLEAMGACLESSRVEPRRVYLDLLAAHAGRAPADFLDVLRDRHESGLRCRHNRHIIHVRARGAPSVATAALSRETSSS